MTSAARSVRSVAVVFAVAGLLGLLFSVVLPQIARAASNQPVEIDLGGGFTSDPRGTVLDTSRLAPGLTSSGTFGVRSGFAGTSDLQLKFVGVSAHNGCAPIHDAGQFCDQGSGDLENELVFDVAVGDARRGPYASTWSGHAADLEHGVVLHGSVQSTQPRWVRLSATLPASAGNETQNDRFAFALQVTLASSAGTDAITVTKDPSTIERIGLAATGASVALLSIAALLLVACGILALVAGRSRGRHVRTAAAGL